MPKLLQRPTVGYEYTTREILTKLHLLDSPALICREGCAIQDSHVTEDQLLSVPGLADLRWIYVKTTYEWIPVFQIVSGQEEQLEACLDFQGKTEKWGENYKWWITPKGYSRVV